MSQIAMKKRSSKKLISVAVAGLLAVLSIFLILQTSKEILTTYQLKQELKVVENELVELQTRQSELALEKEKLEDPGYVQNYARGTHLLSKSEEQVFILPKTKKKR